MERDNLHAIGVVTWLPISLWGFLAPCERIGEAETLQYGYTLFGCHEIDRGYVEKGATMSRLGEIWKPSYAIFFLLIVVASFLAGTGSSKRGANPGSAPGGRRILYYIDPMHPAYKSDQPGIAPDCGMQLEPVYADGGGSGAEGTDPSSLPGGAGHELRGSQNPPLCIRARVRMPERGEQ